MSDPSPTDPQSSWTDPAGAPPRAQGSGDPYASGAAWTQQPPGPGAIPPIQIRPAPPRVVVYLLAMVGALGGLVAAFVEETRSFSPLMTVLVAPTVEEACKPIAVFFMLEKRPTWLRGAGEVVFLSVLGALVFATMENVLYIFVYHPAGSSAFVAWRLIVCTAMHVTASAVMGLGLARAWRHIRRTGRKFSIDQCIWYYVVAVAIHGAYNGTVIVLHMTGVLRFD